MNHWAKRLDKVLKGHDSKLFVQETKPGRYDVYRKSQAGGHMPHFIFALTEDWSPTGVPVCYGYDVVLNRIKAFDLWRDDTFVERWIKEHEKHEESKDRARRNSIEAFLYDFRRQFARATDSVNTGTMDKKVHRKETNYGYR